MAENIYKFALLISCKRYYNLLLVMLEVMGMDQKPVYKRVLLKISGEALAGEKKTGLDFGVIGEVCEAVNSQRLALPLRKLS